MGWLQGWYVRCGLSVEGGRKEGKEGELGSCVSVFRLKVMVLLANLFFTFSLCLCTSMYMYVCWSLCVYGCLSCLYVYVTVPVYISLSLSLSLSLSCC